MNEPQCPRDPSHTGTVVERDNVPEPHHAALLCEECHAHIKWLGKADAKTPEAMLNMSDTEPTICPFRTIVPRPATIGCLQERCQLWWLCDSDGVLAKYLLR